MPRLKIFSTGRCPICDKTKRLLEKWNIPFDEVRVDKGHSGLREMAEATNGSRTVPQITIDGKWIGGFSELTMMHMDDELDHLMLHSDENQ